MHKASISFKTLLVVQNILNLLAYTNSIQMISPRAAPRKLKFTTEKKSNREAVSDIQPLEKSSNEEEKVSTEQKIKGKTKM